MNKGIGPDWDDLPPCDPYEVECARCGKVGTVDDEYPDEPDDIEPPANLRPTLDGAALELRRRTVEKERGAHQPAGGRSDG